MLARWLRLGLAAEVLGATLLAFVLVRYAGLSLPVAVTLAVVALLGAYFLFIAATFVICWPRRNEAIPEQKIGLPAACLMILGEWLAFFALFAVIQPFASVFPPVRAGGHLNQKRPVLLVHGYDCNGGLWWIMRLRSAGLSAETLDLEPPFASIDTFAEQLHDRIEKCLDQTGSEKVRLVTHSMGGLVVRAYLKRHGSDRVEKLITLACPHHGTRIARIGPGQNAREMEPPSSWLAGLDEPASVPVVTVWSTYDNFVSPQTSARLAGAQEIVLTGIGHLSFLFSGRVLAILRKELA